MRIAGESKTKLIAALAFALFSAGLLAFYFTGPGARQPTPTPLPASADLLFDKLSERLPLAFQNAQENPDDNGRYFGWAVSINSFAALTAFDRTGEMRFIELAAESLTKTLDHRDDRIGRRDDVRKRVMKGWGGTRYLKDGRYSTNITLTGRVSFVLLLFVDLVRRHPAQLAHYDSLAADFLTAARESMDDYEGEFVVTGNAGYYVRPTHDDIEPLNHMSWAGNALILLHELTGERKYREMAEGMARYFKRTMIYDGGRVHWPYQADAEGAPIHPIERVWKARTSAQFILFAWQRGVVFSDDDVQAVAQTILTRVFRSDGRVSTRIDGAFYDMERVKGFRGNYLSITPFVAFQCVEPDLRTRIEAMVASRPEIGGWMRGRHGVVGYAHRLGAKPCS